MKNLVTSTKGYDKNKQSYVHYGNVNNLNRWAMSQKLSVSNFEWIEDTFPFNEDFIKNYNKKSDKGYFLEVMLNILKNYINENWQSWKACSMLST